MDAGKLPSELLAQLLARIGPYPSGRVVIGPGLGLDAAVIEMGDSPDGRPSGRLLVAKSDPITFASDLIGWYAVHINANDVACLGARPAWFLATILLPEGSTPSLAETIFDQVLDACRKMEIELVGGHFEITYGLERPIVVGAMLGEVERGRLVRGGGAEPGDCIVLTKGIAIEGTAVLAREAGPTLERLGVPAAVLDQARDYIFRPGLSVVREALLAVDSTPVHAMHDPTEGGVATALHELAAAGGVGLAVDEAAIPVLPCTDAICRAAALDPLGFLASGALLIAVPPSHCDVLLADLAEADIAAACIGSVKEHSDGIIMKSSSGNSEPLPQFARDEVARFLSQKD